MLAVNIIFNKQNCHITKEEDYMNLKELQNIIESAKDYNLKLSADTMNYLFNIYLPVSEAIAENNKAVIKYLLNCEADDRFNILDAIEDGAKRLNPLKSHKLLSIVRADKEKLDITGTNNTLYKSIA